MEDNRSTFDRLSDIEKTEKANNQLLSQILYTIQDNLEPSSKNKETPKNASNKNDYINFIKTSKKSWRWFGSSVEFDKSKSRVKLSFILLLVVGFISSIVSCLCFNTYSTFTFLENIWMIFAIIYLVYLSKSNLLFDIHEYAHHSSFVFESDNVGMLYCDKEKRVFKIFRWFAIISVICNIICIWTGLGGNYKIIATIFEIIFLAAIIVSYFMNLTFNAQYNIIWIEGKNENNNQNNVFVFHPGEKKLLSLEEFKNKVPFLFK